MPMLRHVDAPRVIVARYMSVDAALPITMRARFAVTLAATLMRHYDITRYLAADVAMPLPIFTPPLPMIFTI